jgi:hypothetical protein
LSGQELAARADRRAFRGDNGPKNLPEIVHLHAPPRQPFDFRSRAAGSACIELIEVDGSAEKTLGGVRNRGADMRETERVPLTARPFIVIVIIATTPD